MKLSLHVDEETSLALRRRRYAELRGQATTPASGNAPAQPPLRHDGDISTIIEGNPQVMGEPQIVILAVAHPGGQGVPFLCSLRAGWRSG